MTADGWFAVVYGGLLVSVLAAIRVAPPRWPDAGEDRLDERDLCEVELAMINGGPPLAAVTAVPGLRDGHVVHLAVAIYGSGAVWNADPAFAAALDAPQHLATSVQCDPPALDGATCGCG